MDSIDSHKRGDILSRITNDVDSLQTGITSTFLQFMTAIITLIGVFIMMLSINIWMTLITLVLLPISFIIITQVVKRSQDYYKQQLKYKGNVNTHIEETFGGQDIIRAYTTKNVHLTPSRMIMISGMSMSGSHSFSQA